MASFRRSDEHCIDVVVKNKTPTLPTHYRVSKIRRMGANTRITPKVEKETKYLTHDTKVVQIDSSIIGPVGPTAHKGPNVLYSSSLRFVASR